MFEFVYTLTRYENGRRWITGDLFIHAATFLEAAGKVEMIAAAMNAGRLGAVEPASLAIRSINGDKCAFATLATCWDRPADQEAPA